MKLVLANVLLISVTMYVQAGLPDDIAAKEAAIAELRKTVEPLVEPLLIKDTDIRVFASMSPLVDAMNDLASRPEAARMLNILSTSGNGRFWEDGETWCGSYVELDKPDSFRATAVLSNMNGSVAQDGSLLLTTQAKVNGAVQVKFQFRGARYRFLGGNVCPPGGGAGTSIGVNFDKTVDLNLSIAFKQAQDGRSLGYTAAFTSPDKVSVTANIGLGPIGTIGQPISFNIPKEPIASGSIPLLIANEGKFEMPSGAGEREYIFAMTPVAFSSTQQGIQASWKTAVQFRELSNASTN